MINFEIPIYEDALSLLLNDKTDVKAEILGQLQQGDPCLENIGEELRETCEELVLDTEKIVGRFEEQSCEEIMEYISFSEAGISFDYEESAACGDLRTCAFRVACTFDIDRYLKEMENGVVNVAAIIDDISRYSKNATPEMKKSIIDKIIRAYEYAERIGVRDGYKSQEDIEEDRVLLNKDLDDFPTKVIRTLEDLANDLFEAETKKIQVNNSSEEDINYILDLTFCAGSDEDKDVDHKIVVIKTHEPVDEQKMRNVIAKVNKLSDPFLEGEDLDDAKKLPLNYYDGLNIDTLLENLAAYTGWEIIGYKEAFKNPVTINALYQIEQWQ